MDIYQDKISLLVKKSILKNIEKFDGRAILLFSGGRDSCAMVSAFNLLFPGSQLELLVFDNGVSSFMELAQKQAEYLRKKFRDIEIIFVAKSSRRLMKEAVIAEIENNFLKDNFSSLLVCIGCKLVMFYLAAQEALENGINIIMDGFSERQKHYPEQTEVFMKYIEELYLKNGLIYISPLYKMFKNNKEIVDYLISIGLDWGEKQPLCIFGGTYSQAKSNEIQQYLAKCIINIENSFLLKS